MAVLLARRWFPGCDPWDPEIQAGAIIMDKRESQRIQTAVHTAITRAIRFK